MYSDHDGQPDGHHDGQIEKRSRDLMPIRLIYFFILGTMITTTATHTIQHPVLVEGYEIRIMDDTEKIYFYHSETRLSTTTLPNCHSRDVKIWNNDFWGNPLHNQMYGQPPPQNNVPATSFTRYVS